jgi:hypothetical protein
MRNLFAVPWMSPRSRTLLSFVVVGVLVLSVFALLKTNGSGKQAPAQELVTGSIQRSPAVRKARSNDSVEALLASSFSQGAAQIAVDRAPVPMPRPRPKRL